MELIMKKTPFEEGFLAGQDPNKNIYDNPYPPNNKSLEWKNGYVSGAKVFCQNFEKEKKYKKKGI